MKKNEIQETYSAKIEGGKENWDYAAQFDITGNVVGIDQYNRDDGELQARIILTMKQFDYLCDFVKRHRSKKR